LGELGKNRGDARLSIIKVISKLSGHGDRMLIFGRNRGQRQERFERSIQLIQTLPEGAGHLMRPKDLTFLVQPGHLEVSATDIPSQDLHQ
jgi:hypothetical protein